MNIGIDIGGSHISAGLVNGSQIISRKELSITENDKKDISMFLEMSLIKLINMILLQNNLYIADIDMIGIASPGNIVRGKVITNCYNLGIDRFDIYKALRKYYKYVDIKVKNDAKCAAIAEKTYGNLKGYKNALFLCFGTGVGGAVIQGGKLLEARNCTGFELGHMSINKNGPTCKCGKKGCFDVYGSMKNFKRKLTKKIGLKPNSISFEIIPELKKKESKDIDKIIDSYVYDLSVGISNLVNIFEPEVIVIGGSFAHYEEILLEKLKIAIVSNDLLFNKRKDINIVSARFLNDAGIIGAGNL